MYQQKGNSYIETHWKKINCHQTKRKKTTTTTSTETEPNPKEIGSGTGIGTSIYLYKFKLKMANTLSVMTNVLRNVVSKKRIRYKEKGFNLDLAYICDNIIAMGYPADNIESIYRNRLEDVYKFLEENHQDHYKIYNLCLERSYDINKFHRRVAVYPFEDHNPPTIELIQKFCDDVNSWLKMDSLNVAAVHCKAGKGRTGTMICCYLLYSGQQSTPEDALACYDEKRTKDRKGVTIPSQRRYVQYFSKLIRSGLRYERRTLQFCEIRFSEANLLHSQGIVHCSISVLQDTPCAVKVQPLQNLCIDFRKSFILDIKNASLAVAGDIKVELTHKTSRKKIFHFWFNTFFVCDEAVLEDEGGEDESKLIYTLYKSEIDDAHKDKEHKCFSEDFKVQLVFYAGWAAEERTQQQQQNNYAMLPQNSSSGSDLNYICDQKSSSSAASASVNSLLGDISAGNRFGLAAAAALPTTPGYAYFGEMNAEPQHPQQQHQQQHFVVKAASTPNHHNHQQQQHSQYAAAASSSGQQRQSQSQLQYQPSASFHSSSSSCHHNNSGHHHHQQHQHNNSNSSSSSNNSSISSHSSVATGVGGGVGCDDEEEAEDWESAITTNGSSSTRYAITAPPPSTAAAAVTTTKTLLSNSGSATKDVHLHPYNGKIHAKKCAHAAHKNHNNRLLLLHQEEAVLEVGHPPHPPKVLTVISKNLKPRRETT